MQFNLQICDLANFTLTQTIQRLLILWSNHRIWRRLMREKLTSLRRSMGVFFRSRKRFGSVFIEREFNNELKQSQTTAWRIRKKRGPPFVRDDVKYQTYCTVWFNLIGCVCLYNTYNRKMHWLQLFFFFNQDFCINLWVHLRKWHSWTRYAYPASTHDFYTYLSLEAFSSSIGGSFVQAAVSDLACGYTSFPPYHTRDTVYPKRKMENDPLLHVWKNVGENKNNFINELRSVFCIHFVLHCYISLWNACHSKGKEKQTYP